MKEKKVFLIGNAHIDPVWQWRWQDGFQEIRSTFKSVLDRMEEFPDFKFTCAGSMYYEWIEEVDPETFERIKARIREGRWCVAGGMYLQPDCNLPCGEAFCRECLTAQRYFKEKFGFYAKTGYNVDSFGHNGGLPQILAKSGLTRYVFMRPDKTEKELPASLFIWKGADGTRMPAYRVPVSYCIKTIEPITEIKKLGKEENLNENAFFGVGNHGGGPTIKLLTETDELIEKEEGYLYGTIDEYFDYAEACGEIAAAKVVEGDLQYHSRGCYSLNTMIKKKNREAENALLSAEIFSSVANFAVKAKYPQEGINSAWKTLFLCQFHDNLAGTVTKPATEDMRDFFGSVITEAERDINLALTKISWEIDTLCGNPNDIFRTDTFYPFVHEKLGSPIVVFNSLPHPVKRAVRIYPRCSLVTDYSGNVLPSQLIRGYHTDGKDNIYNTLIYLEVPAFGYRTLKIFREKTAETENPFVCGEDFIETPFVKATFSRETGGIKSVFDKKTKKELLSAPSFCYLADETNQDSWMHGKALFGKEVGRFTFRDMHVIERGPARAAMRVTSACGESEITQDFFVYPEGSRVEAKVKIYVKDKHRSARFVFPANTGENPRAITENAFGHIEREANGDEYPCGRWFACFGSGGGIAVANDGKYSFAAKENVCYLTVLRTAIYLDHFAAAAGSRDEFCEYMEEAPSEFSYSVTPYSSASAATKEAEELNVPLRSVTETFHGGSLKTEYEGISVESENVKVTAMKKAEDGKGYILRAYECEGVATETEINLACANARFTATFAPFEIKTFRIEGARVSETDLKEDEL